jgi:hypothetical protein
MDELILQAAETGDLNKVRKVPSFVWYVRAQIIRDGRTELKQLKIAVHNGHLNVVKWMRKTIGLDQGDSVFVVREACCYGHLHIAQWAAAKWDVSSVMCDMFELACLRGYLHVAQWAYTMMPTLRCNDTRISINRVNKQINQLICVTQQLSGRASWSRVKHRKWYLRPHAVTLAARLPRDVMFDVMRTLTAWT